MGSIKAFQYAVELVSIFIPGMLYIYILTFICWQHASVRIFLQNITIYNLVARLFYFMVDLIINRVTHSI